MTSYSLSRVSNQLIPGQDEPTPQDPRRYSLPQSSTAKELEERGIITGDQLHHLENPQHCFEYWEHQSKGPQSLRLVLYQQLFAEYQ